MLYQGREVACHVRCYDRGQLIRQDAHHLAALKRRVASVRTTWKTALTRWARKHERFHLALRQRPVKTVVHLRRLLNLVRLYGRAEVVAAITQANAYQTYDAAYVETILLQERRRRELPSPTEPRPRRVELIEEIDLEEPDPGLTTGSVTTTRTPINPRRKRMTNPQQRWHEMLQRDLRELKLYQIAETYREVLDEAARQNTSMLEVLATLIASEVTRPPPGGAGAAHTAGQVASAEDAGRLRLHLPQTHSQTEDPPPV